MSRDEALHRVAGRNAGRRGKSDQFGVAACFDLGTEFHEAYGLVALIPVCPPEIMLRGEQAEDRAIALYASWCLRTHDDVPEDTVVVRTFLVQSVDLKRFWARSRVLVNEIGIDLRLHPMPKWVWVTEYGSLGDFSKSHHVFGFIVQDAGEVEGGWNIINIVLLYMRSESWWVNPDRTYTQKSHSPSPIPAFSV